MCSSKCRDSVQQPTGRWLYCSQCGTSNREAYYSGRDGCHCQADNPADSDTTVVRGLPCDVQQCDTGEGLVQCDLCGGYSKPNAQCNHCQGPLFVLLCDDEAPALPVCSVCGERPCDCLFHGPLSSYPTWQHSVLGVVQGK